MEVILTSNSQIKNKAVQIFLKSINENRTIVPHTQVGTFLQNQPYNQDGERCCFVRYYSAVVMTRSDWIISIENYIDTKSKTDLCIVLLKIDDIKITAVSPVTCPLNDDYFQELMLKSPIGSNQSVTYGEIVAKHNKSVDPANWMLPETDIDRVYQIVSGLELAYKKYKLIRKINFVPDYPIPGITFENVLPLFETPTSLRDLTEIMVRELKEYQPDVLVGLESRGFLFGSVAKELNAGFIPIRKKGKLPGMVHRVDYEKEYGLDTVEMSINPRLHGLRAIIVDDLIATGGSMAAAIGLCQKNKLEIVACSVLRDVSSLRNVYLKKIKVPLIRHLSF